METYDIPKMYLKDGYSFLIKEEYEQANKKIPKELGMKLQVLYSDHEYAICTHKTSVDEKTRKDIFNNGLMNSGENEIEHTAVIKHSLPQLINEVNCYGPCGLSRFFSDVILIKIPKKDLGLAPGDPKPIWFNSNEKRKKIKRKKEMKK
jgi:hypothetical protein